MAIKITLAAVLLVALVAVATATSYTTTVTTTTTTSEDEQQQQQCQRQLQGRRFWSCQRYLAERSSQQEEEVIVMSTGNSGQQQQQELQQCCEQLRKVNEQCRCEAIKQAMRQMQPEMGQSQQQQVYQKAMNLPRMCNIRPQQCQIRVVVV